MSSMRGVGKASSNTSNDGILLGVLIPIQCSVWSCVNSTVHMRYHAIDMLDTWLLQSSHCYYVNAADLKQGRPPRCRPINYQIHQPNSLLASVAYSSSSSSNTFYPFFSISIQQQLRSLLPFL